VGGESPSSHHRLTLLGSKTSTSCSSFRSVRTLIRTLHLSGSELGRRFMPAGWLDREVSRCAATAQRLFKRSQHPMTGTVRARVGSQLQNPNDEEKGERNKQIWMPAISCLPMERSRWVGKQDSPQVLSLPVFRGGPQAEFLHERICLFRLWLHSSEFDTEHDTASLHLPTLPPAKIFPWHLLLPGLTVGSQKAKL